MYGALVGYLNITSFMCNRDNKLKLEFRLKTILLKNKGVYWYLRPNDKIFSYKLSKSSSQVKV